MQPLPLMASTAFSQRFSITHLKIEALKFTITSVSVKTAGHLDSRRHTAVHIVHHMCCGRSTHSCSRPSRLRGWWCFQHVEHEIQVGVVEFAYGLGPRLHLLVLLCREVADEKMKHEQRCDSYYHGCHNEQNLNTSYLVCPLHTDIIMRLIAVYCLARLHRRLRRKSYLQFFLTLF